MSLIWIEYELFINDKWWSWFRDWGNWYICLYFLLSWWSSIRNVILKPWCFEVWFRFVMVPLTNVLYMYWCWIMGIDQLESKLGGIISWLHSLYFSIELLYAWPCMALCGVVHLWLRCLIPSHSISDVVMDSKEIVLWKCYYDDYTMWSIMPSL